MPSGASWPSCLAVAVLLQYDNGKSFHIGDAWFTGCTYAHIAPPVLSSVSGTDPVMQVLQMMPFANMARKFEATMQRLVLVSTADCALLLLRWSEKPTAVRTGSGSLVLLDQVRLPYPVLQFLRQEPQAWKPLTGQPEEVLLEHNCSIKRALPWEAELLVRQAVSDEALQGNTISDGIFRGSGSTTASGSSTNGGNSEGERPQRRIRSVSKGRGSHVGPLVRDFPSYGVGIVLKSSGRVLRSLDPQVLHSAHGGTQEPEGQLLAITPLPTVLGVLASVVSKSARISCTGNSAVGSNSRVRGSRPSPTSRLLFLSGAANLS